MMCVPGLVSFGGSAVVASEASAPPTACITRETTSQVENIKRYTRGPIGEVCLPATRIIWPRIRYSPAVIKVGAEEGVRLWTIRGALVFVLGKHTDNQSRNLHKERIGVVWALR